MITKTKWTIGFLLVTIIAVAMELWAVYDGSPDTQPWTTLYINNIPMWIGVPIVVFFATWLVKHFYTYYKNRKVNK